MKKSDMVTVKELSEKKGFRLCNKETKKSDFIYEKVNLRNNCTAGLVMFFFAFIIFCAVSVITENFFIELMTLLMFAGEVLCGFLLYFQMSDSKKYDYRITAVKKIKNRFVKYYVYTSYFEVFNDGSFFCGKNEKVPFHYGNENEALNEWEKRCSASFFDFYIEVYDCEEKKYLSNKDVFERFLSILENEEKE